MVWKFCESDPLWHAIDLHRQMAASRYHEDFSTPLSSIKSWIRGCELERDAESKSPFIRLTFDSRGLCAIEKLSEWPSCALLASRFKAFIVKSIDCLSDVLVDFKVSVSQLL